MLFIVLLAAIYVSVGLVIGRGQYAREVYKRSLWTQHNRVCPARDDRDGAYSNYAKRICTCGFFNKKPDEFNYIMLVPFWFPWALYVVPKKIVTGGEYVPKELRAERKMREAKELERKLNERIDALEVETGIRKK